jgi:hypothetical protein
VTSPDSERSEAWRKALEIATTLRSTADALHPPPEQEWLRYVISEAADAIRASVLWAATNAEARPDEQPGVATLRRLVVAADSTRGDALVASYFVAFAHDQGAIDDVTAERLGAGLAAVEASMDAISRELTSRLGFDPYQAKAASQA